MMKKYIVLLLCLFAINFTVSAQANKKKSTPKDWHLLDYAQDSVYGISLDRAYELLSSRTPKQKTIVAVIDSGGDINHEDLKSVLWTNKGEILGNGIDDDKNGYIDDIHGWNFLGKADGAQIHNANTEADREYLKFYAKYFKADSTQFKGNELVEYNYFVQKILPRSKINAAYQSRYAVDRAFEYKQDFIEFIQELHPEQQFIDKNDIIKLRSALNKNKELKSDSKKNSAFYFFVTNLGQLRSARIDIAKLGDFLDKERLEWEEEYINRYKIALATAILNENEIVKNSANGVYYGNNNVLAPSMDHGTHVAGIIGADRSNNIGIKGIADVEIMFIRILAGSSDETDKDIAAAIRYAVDNGARVVNMSFGKAISPDSKLVNDAIRYAAKKNVLLVHAAGNNSIDIDVNDNYPDAYYTVKGRNYVHNNMLTIGACAYNGTPARFSNFGKKSVDIFAQGADIYSTVQDNSYKNMSGTSMAAPVASGVAALLLNYFPNLTVTQLKKAIIDGGVCCKDVTVYKPQSGMFVDKDKLEKVKFGELSVHGKILNAEGAVKEAIKMIK